MKIRTTKEKLQLALSKVQGGVSAKTALPILANVLLEADENTLALTTTDLDIGIRYSLEVEVLEGGATTLPAKRLFNIAKELPEGEIVITVGPDNIATITSENAYFRVVGLSKEEFPKLPQFPEGKDVEIPSAVLSDMIEKTSYAVSTDEARYVLTGEYFSVKGGNLTIVATDGRRLAHIEKGLGLPKDVEISCIIPKKSVDELRKLLDEESTVKVAVAKNQIGFMIPNLLFISRLIEGHYPNYKQVIPKGYTNRIVINRESFLSALKRSAIVTSEQSNAVKLHLTKGQILFSANTPDIGEEKENLSVDYNGDDIEIAFNPSYLMDVLKHMDDEEVVFELENSDSPGVIRKDKEFTYVIMPMRLA